jgi:L-alanine-DL-glutamate epimerase-like enolase superfamily enzyme
MRAPLVAAHGSDRQRPLVVVAVTDDDGVTGHGEAAPLESYDGTTLAAVLAALACASPEGQIELPQARAAIEMAGWDMRGRREQQPVWRLLGAARPPAVELNATIGAEAPHDAAAEAALAVRAGYTCVKVKVGLGDDSARVAAVREAVGADIAIRIDANGAWSVREAIAALGRLAAYGIECCEEPVHGVEALAEVSARTEIPISADETATDPRIFARHVCQAVCLKIASSGGIGFVVQSAIAARAAGYEVYLASTLDGPLGIAAALHAAAVIEPDRPCGLATLDRFAATNPLPVAGGRLAPPPGPGLGDGLLAWYE